MFVLLSDPDAELSNWPLELVALREKIHGDVARVQTDKELSSLRDDVSAGEADKWRQRRNNSFDQNRQLEEVTKERDALQRLAGALQHAVSQLVAYCASAEDELNRTVLAHLLPTLQAQQSFCEESRASLNCSVELDSSLVSRGRHVHFAPELQSILAALDEQGAAGFLQEQRDLSADIKRELEYALLRLRHEAHELLDLSARLANKGQPQTNMLESSQVEITELQQDSDTKQKSCDNCELLKKTMEETTAECLQRENLLRSDLDDAMMKIAQLMTDRGDSTDVIVEGYGTCGVTVRRTGCRSLDEVSPRSQMHALARDLELLQRDRDDLHQQLEAANRQLRSTRQFVEEQAAEREHERDEFARRLQDLRDENVRLTARLQSSARILSEMHGLRTHARCPSATHVEQLEAQTREMNQIITDLETRKAATDEELKSSEEKITLLRDIIASLEGQLEQKVKREAEIIEQLESMKKTIDERDSKMRALLGELESLRSEKADQTEVTICENCAQEESKYEELLEKVQEQCGWLTAEVEGRRRALQAAHELADTSSHSEELSLRDCRHAPLQDEELEKMESVEWLCPVVEVREALRALARAEDAALKRLADLRVQRDRLSRVAQVSLHLLALAELCTTHLGVLEITFTAYVITQQA
ncbi:unnamed protein product [Parnassius apollo]|uniref:(apollo) hypothetical protein n=1 Tax=Parnassius apollo TaxID=110799 RepID=A0A8S3W637_PARAO|nr:unnamed protein product [Parnassius apollo]